MAVLLFTAIPSNYINAEYINENIYTYYYGATCSHCIKVEKYLKESGVDQEIRITTKEVQINRENAQELLDKAESLWIPTNQVGTPFIVVQEKNGFEYALIWEAEAINHFKILEQQIKDLHQQNTSGENTPPIKPENPNIDSSNTGNNVNGSWENFDWENLPSWREIQYQGIKENGEKITLLYNSVIWYETEFPEEQTLPNGNPIYKGYKILINNEVFPVNNIQQFKDGGSTKYITTIGDLYLHRKINEELYNSRNEEKLQDINSSEKKDISLGERMKFFAIMMPAALADSINPCAFAVMLLLLTSILSKTANKKKALQSGIMFALAVFVTYFLLGMGVLKLLGNMESLFWLKRIVGIIGILVGLANLKDYFWYGKGFIMEVPMSWRPLMQKIVKKVTSPWGAFVVGVIVSLFLLPCSSGPYLTILGYLSAESQTLNLRWYTYLTVYNLIFVLPMLAIAALIGFGYSTAEKIGQFKNKNTKLIHLIVGLLMLGLGIYVIGSIYRRG